MKASVLQLTTLVFASLLCFAPSMSFAQNDAEVKVKQGELKQEYNDLQDKAQIIRAAALDKTPPGRRRGAVSTGYDFTQVKGYTVKPTADLAERLDQVFFKSNELELFSDKYNKNGTFAVAGRKGNATSAITRIEVYYVESRPEELDQNQDLAPYDLIEIRVIKQENLPATESAGDGDDEEAGAFGFSGALAEERVTKDFILSGPDLWNVLQMYDQTLFDDVLARRTQEPSIPLPADLFFPTKRGPFLVMTPDELSTATSRFTDFWNPKDTMRTVPETLTGEAAGPFTKQAVPVLYPEIERIRVRGFEKDASVKITRAQFEGENAQEFEVVTKLPLLLPYNESANIEFKYIGSSPYEVRGSLFIEARELGRTQEIPVLVNPGVKPTDFVTIDASLDKIELRSPSRSSFAPDWKLSYSVGNDEIGLPRWSSGMSTLSIGYKHEMSVGLVLPMNMMTGDFPAPLGYDLRPLASPMGYNVAFDFAFGFPFALGGNLTIANKFDGVERYEHLITKDHFSKDNPEKLLRNNFWHIGTVAQVYYPIMFKDRAENPSVVFRLNIGGAFMQIQRNHLVEIRDIDDMTRDEQISTYGREFTSRDIDKMFTIGKEKDIVDVYIRVGFINVAAKNPYGLGMQYYSGRMMADAWLELTNWFRVEAKYSFLLRDRELWENDASFFMISPRFRFGLPSLFN